MADRLKTLAGLCHQMAEREEEVAQAEIVLQEAKNRLAEVANDLIPDYFNELGLTELTLEDGRKVTIQDVYQPKVTDQSFMKWLEQNGRGDVIKNEFKLSFGMKEQSRADEVFQLLIEQGIAPESKVYVHPSTLKALVKELIEGGASLPDSVSVNIFQRTKIGKQK